MRLRVTRVCLAIFSCILHLAQAWADAPSYEYPDLGAYRLRFTSSRRCLSGPIKLSSQDGYGMSIRSTSCVASSGGATDQHFFLPQGWDDSVIDPITGPLRLLESRLDFGMCISADHGFRPMYGNCMRHHAHSWHVHQISEGLVTIELPETHRCLVDEAKSDYVRMGDCSSPRALLHITQVSRRSS
jgi:hypothetical protein